VRGIIIPRSKDNILVAADYRQLEFRIVLWYAFVKTLGREYPKVSNNAFEWLVERSEGKFARAADIAKRDERSIAKRIVHAGDYLEGLKIFKSLDLRSSRTKSLVDRGAIILHKDWECDGGIVGFTGVNLAKSLFGSATDENRKMALEIQELFFSQFPEIRVWHRSLVPMVEAKRAVSHTGRVLDLYGDTERRYKECAAFLGQGGGADYAQEGFIRMTESGTTPVLFVHDELAIEAPRCYTKKKWEEMMRDSMEIQSSEFEGFSCPTEVKWGENWLDMEVLG
jgi:DNA polymerase I-like protein with 3'-5' exonuclease and polymerase domains